MVRLRPTSATYTYTYVVHVPRLSTRSYILISYIVPSRAPFDHG